MKHHKQNSLHKVVARVTVISTVVLAGFSFPASADWYGAVNMGNSEVDESSCGDLISLGVPSCSEDLKDTGWKLAVGNQFNTNAAVEFGYADLGEAKISLSGPGGSATCKGGTTAFTAGIAGSLPATKELSFTGRVGLARWDLDGSCSGVVSLSYSDSGTDLTFGVGARYDITKTVGLRGEWERFDVDDADLNLLSFGLIFMFK